MEVLNKFLNVKQRTLNYLYRQLFVSSLKNVMKKQIEPLYLNSENLSQSSFSIVGKFCIENSCFLIVVFPEYAEESQKSSFNDSTVTLRSTPLGSFEFNEKCYFIVKAENAVGNSDSVLVNLLTERELQIATLTALGRSNKQIASHLHISEWTVSAHLRRIFIKLNVDSRAAMVYRCALLIDRVNQPCSILHQTFIGNGTEKVLETSDREENCQPAPSIPS